MKKAKIFLPYLLAGILCLLITIPVSSNSVELDEAYSINLVRGSIGEIVKGAAADVHPPLYYLILKLSALFGGESLVKYRFVTALAAYLNLFLLGATIIRKYKGCRVAVLYILWFGVSYCTFERSVVVRMYSWAAFFVTAAALFAYGYYKKGKLRDYILAIAMTIAAMYTHYYAVMAVFFVWVLLLVFFVIYKRRQTGRVIFGGLIVAAAYLPWLRALISQSSRVADDYWISGFDWKEWFETPAQLMDSSLPGIGMVHYFFVFVALLLAVIRRNKAALCCALVFAATMVSGALLSAFVAPIWVGRYLYAAWGLLALLVALAVGEMRGEYSLLFQGVFSGILCITGVFSVQGILQDELVTSTADEWVAFLEENISAEDIIIVDDPYEHKCVFEYYLPDNEIVMSEELKPLGGSRELEEILKHSGENQVWYIIDTVQPRLGLERMIELMETAGYEMQSRAAYTIKYKALQIYQAEGEAE